MYRHLYWYYVLDEFKVFETDPGFLCDFRYHPQHQYFLKESHITVLRTTQLHKKEQCFLHSSEVSLLFPVSLHQ